MVTMGHGGLEQMVLHEDWPTPQPGADDVLVQVSACGLGNTDVDFQSGWYSKTVSEATTESLCRGRDETDRADARSSFHGSRSRHLRQGIGVGTDVDAARIGEIITDNWIRDPATMNKTGGGY